jgi:hypothetical protein
MPLKVKPPYVQAAPRIEPGQDKLTKIKETLRQARDLKLEKAQLTERLAKVNADIGEIERKILPDMAMDAGIDMLGLEAEGNLPAYDMEIKPYYHANIKEDDPNAAAAYAWLSKTGHGDLIKHTYTIAFGLKENRESQAFAKALEKMNLRQGYSVKIGVPWNSLTAFLREQVEVKKTIPPLDLINGQIGQIANIKPRK